MTKEEFDKVFKLIDSYMKNAPIEIENAYKILKSDYVEQVKKSFEKEKLIKYLENMLDGTIKDKFIVTSVVDLLEKVKSGKYE